MDVLMNGLLLAASLFAGSYCWVLARRVRDLKSLDTGLGGALVTLTRQIELARGTLDDARAATRENGRDLDRLITRAEAAAATLKGALATARDMETRLTLRAHPPAEPAPPAPPAQPARATPGQPNLRLAVLADEPAFTEPADTSEFVAASGRAPSLEDFVPKPRSLPPIENPLRPRTSPRRVSAPESEDELLEALSALAGGRR
jgi:hypothetical protein